MSIRFRETKEAIIMVYPPTDLTGRVVSVSSIRAWFNADNMLTLIDAYARGIYTIFTPYGKEFSGVVIDAGSVTLAGIADDERVIDFVGNVFHEMACPTREYGIECVPAVLRLIESGEEDLVYDIEVLEEPTPDTIEPDKTYTMIYASVDAINEILYNKPVSRSKIVAIEISAAGDTTPSTIMVKIPVGRERITIIDHMLPDGTSIVSGVVESDSGVLPLMIKSSVKTVMDRTVKLLRAMTDDVDWIPLGMLVADKRRVIESIDKMFKDRRELALLPVREPSSLIFI